MSILLKKVGNIVSNIALCLIITVLIVVLGLRAMGMEFFVVRTGSMYPSYPIGTMILVSPTDFSQLNVGDVITFMADKNTAVTHRIYTIDTQNKTLVTKGDNNNTSDKSINADSIVGKVVFSIPYLGYISIFADTIYGKITISAIAVFIVAMIIYNFICAVLNKKMTKSKDKQDNNI